MPTDEEIARRALDLQARARDIPLGQIPGYMEWSNQRLKEGESAAFIAHLDATCMWLVPEEIDSVSTEDFDEMLAELKDELDGAG